nr:reverse transcriptase domain-containing protein [Tanacetum cinerariifolium]
MVPATTSLTGFSGETTWPLGQLKLLVTIGDATHSTKAWMNFMIVKSLSPYNGIIGRPGLNAVQAIPSTVHGMLKFPTEEGNNLQLSTNTCRMCIMVGGSLSDEGRAELCSLLKRNLDIFAWQPSDMTGVPRSVAEHRLNVREGCPPVRQKKRGQAPERTKAIQAEVKKLVEAGIMREVYYHDWLSNPVMVKKHDGSWRMCVDFTDLNKACPQDCYPLPEIDWKVESLCGYPFKCFLDAYKGYHQIQMAAADEEKTAFHTGQGVYCYTKMPFGLKNAGATYQRLMDMAFENQMGRNIEVYVDDLVVKSHTKGEMRKEYSLDASLLYKPYVTGSGTKLLPDGKAGVITGLGSKKASKIFSGTSYRGNHRPAHKKVMSRPDAAGRLQKWSIMLGEHNIAYRPRTSINGQVLADFLNEIPSNASQGASAAETQEEPWTLFTDGSSCVDGSGAGLILTNSDGVEFTYALSQVARSKNKKADALSKIASTSFTYLSKQVLVEVLETKSITRKEVTAVIEEEGPTWMTELMNYLKEGTLPEDKMEARKLRLKARQYELMEGILYKRSFLTPWLRFQFAASNNEAEYEALIAGLRIETQMGVKNIQANVDSKLVANQVLGTYVAKEDNMIKYLEIAKGLVSGFKTFSISQVPRSKNKKADALSKIASTSFAQLSKQVLVEVLETKLITSKEVTTVIEEEGPTWMTELVNYLKEGTLPEDEKVAQKLRLKARHQVPDRRNGLLHKVDRSKSGGNDHRRTSEEIRMGQYCMPLRYSRRNNLRQRAVDVVNNDEELRLNLDLLEERRELAAINEARSKSKMTKYYNSRVRGVAFQPGDFVYRSNDASHAAAGGKLGPKWEGPYEVTDALENGAYKLRTRDGTMLPRTWNVANLKQCYL